MFEAHYLVEPDYPVSATPLNPAQTRRLYSDNHQCPLHVWPARGKRKDQHGIPRPHWFLYIEYCRHDGTHACLTLERPCSQPLQALFDEASWHELPAIDPRATGLWLTAGAPTTE